MNIAYEIERLITFSLRTGIIAGEDVIWARNTLLGLFGANAPYESSASYEGATAEAILSNMLDWCFENGLIHDNTATARDLMSARIMGAIMARPTEVIGRFNALYAQSPQKATDWFYNLCRDANYIQVDRIAKNIEWTAQTPYGDMEITINLSKPEKSAEEVEAALKAPASGYPKCLLCAENEGCFGSANHPARQNIRLIPVKLGGGEWFFQYSPYVYYNEHCIVLSRDHTPLDVNEKTMARLFDFIDLFPHYFLGSNAALPGVGGSILAHDHYQGGRHVFPMEKAAVYKGLSHPAYKGVAAGLVKWPMPVIRMWGEDRGEISRLATRIMKLWDDYDDESVGIIAHTDARHNTTTPIARKNKDGLYEADIVLRNNRTTAERPIGLFHPRPELHHIKQESIGLIEVMGLAILPGRLEKETAAIADILTGKRRSGDLGGIERHGHWVKRLADAHGTANGEAEATAIIRADMGRIFTEVLADAGVFKDTEHGRERFGLFVDKCGFV